MYRTTAVYSTEKENLDEETKNLPCGFDSGGDFGWGRFGVRLS